MSINISVFDDYLLEIILNLSNYGNMTCHCNTTVSKQQKQQQSPYFLKVNIFRVVAI